MKKNKKRRIKSRLEELEVIEQDEHFYYIAGHTDGGFSFGITWEEYFDDIYKFVDGDFYCIYEADYDGKVMGVTWQDYLKQLDKDLENSGE